MKLFFTSLFLLSFSLDGYCQDTITNDKSEKKYQICFKAGGTYQNFIGSNYIVRNYENSSDYQLHQYDGFTKVPTLGFQAGSLCGGDAVDARGNRRSSAPRRCSRRSRRPGGAPSPGTTQRRAACAGVLLPDPVR